MFVISVNTGQVTRVLFYTSSTRQFWFSGVGCWQLLHRVVAVVILAREQIFMKQKYFGLRWRNDNNFKTADRHACDRHSPFEHFEHVCLLLETTAASCCSAQEISNTVHITGTCMAPASTQTTMLTKNAHTLAWCLCFVYIGLSKMPVGAAWLFSLHATPVCCLRNAQKRPVQFCILKEQKFFNIRLLFVLLKMTRYSNLL